MKLGTRSPNKYINPESYLPLFSGASVDFHIACASVDFHIASKECTCSMLIRSVARSARSARSVAENCHFSRHDEQRRVPQNFSALQGLGGAALGLASGGCRSEYWRFHCLSVFGAVVVVRRYVLARSSSCRVAAASSESEDARQDEPIIHDVASGAEHLRASSHPLSVTAVVQTEAFLRAFFGEDDYAGTVQYSTQYRLHQDWLPRSAQQA